ncbi:hypothetical protein [Fictibacillus fluitans]|uniref:DUF4064 domain-containing protein n=1 Tax=Fictibacillus fluitans TaxID=3058422 RepID=A0ABT8HQL5_9BACL|nr:hypothetical protein [Fictibacillus sp. NE201]MDN4523054.1 hypothetical protein [Fictibacillus sp. NE201]
MEKYTVSRTIGLFAGIIIILSALGFGGLYMLGASLGKALGSQTGPSVDLSLMAVILLCISLIGFITGSGSLGLKRKGWRNGFIVFCWSVGLFLLIVFFSSLGALGKAIEFLILCVCGVYFLLGYLVKKEV